jgi:hypothetical protein
MKNEPRKPKAPKSLDERFAQHPQMYEQMQRIADEMEQAIAKGVSADDAEAMAIQRMQALGRAMVSDWAKARHEQSLEEVRQEQPASIRDSKKK